MPRNPLPPPRLNELPLMTPWYGPKALAQTGFRVFASNIISSYADQRILQAAIDNAQAHDLVGRYDYSQPEPQDGALWVDYMADTGDGFDSTYSIASLLGAPSITVESDKGPLELPQGEILFLGGDQAYPYASVEAYQKRFVQPFELTHWHDDPAKPKPRRRLFALPGNHDWYDGLSGFDRLFCGNRDRYSTERSIGQWQCKQHRSYWAVKLPYDWWIWGLDVQLDQNVDIGQIQYFHTVAASMTSPPDETKLIICIPTPSWLEGHESQSVQAYSTNLVHIFNLAVDKGKVCAVLSGDWHHYSRYFSSDHRLNLISAGGGGAYLAPTHDLPHEIIVPWRSSSAAEPAMLPFTLNGSPSTDDVSVKNEAGEPRPESVFPPRMTSRWLSWKILLFPLYNPTFCMALGFFYFLMWWFYTSTYISISETLSTELPGIETYGYKSGKEFVVPMDVILSGGRWLGFGEQFRLPWSVSRWQPFFAFTALGIFGLIFGFLAGSKRPLVRLAESVILWLLHIYAMSALAQIILSLGPKIIPDRLSNLGVNPVWYSAAMFILASGVAGTMSGIYLFLSNRVFGTITDTAFSAIRVINYKNFLRLRISRDELTIYPIGLKSVPKRGLWLWRAGGWRQPTDAEIDKGATAAYVARKGLKPQLIERPIVIRPEHIVDLDPLVPKPAYRPPAPTSPAATASAPVGGSSVEALT
jgi:hypothetical protein